MLNSISPYITKDEPFGPIDSVDIDSTDLNALKLLFEQHNWTYKNLRNRPSIIIGRRGSGKTYYLQVYSLTNNMTFIPRSEPRVCLET